MYFNKIENIAGVIEFISRNSNFSAITVEVSDTGVVVNEEGRKIVPRGTIYPANDETAQGVLVNDVDVTHGPNPGSLMDAGYVYKDRLPEEPAEAAVTALTHVVFE